MITIIVWLVVKNAVKDVANMNGVQNAIISIRNILFYNNYP